MVQIRDSKKRKLTLIPKTAQGKPGKIDPNSIPTWESSDAAVATVEPASDGLTAYVVGQAEGTATITAVADADLGEGVRNVTQTLEVEVIPSDTAVLDIGVGDEEDQ